MKKLFLSVMLVAFGLAVNAGEGKSCDKSGACPLSGKKVSAEAKAACPASAKQAKQVKAGCCPSGAKAKTTVAKVDSPKALEQARN